MKSYILTGKTVHRRSWPISHNFVYPVWMLLLDLDELESGVGFGKLLAYNQAGLLSIHQQDYLKPGQKSLREKLAEFLAQKGFSEKIERIALLTSPRILGYVFNPVSFFLLFDKQDRLLGVIAEVRNTFREKHLYLLDAASELASDSAEKTYRVKKEFYVSPFNAVEGDYQVRVRATAGKLAVHFSLLYGDRKIFEASVDGALRWLSRASLLRTLFRYPLSMSLSIPRILWEAATLYYTKQLPVQFRPELSSPDSYSIKGASSLQVWSMRRVDAYLQRFRQGALTLVLPDGQERIYGSRESNTRALLRVKDYAFFFRVLLGHDVALGEAYVDGLIDSDDITAVLDFFISNHEHSRKSGFWLHDCFKFLFYMRHWLRRNSKAGSRKNIHAHYDLSNNLFETFLDETLSYSSALYQSGSETLRQAQKNKIHRIIRKAEIRAEDHVLEIGSGWGGLAIEAVQLTGCRVTTITLSKEQKALAEKRIAAAGLSEKIEVLLMDYRELKGQYDKIVSVEMIEAVGHQYYGTFFQKCDELLKPGGLMVLQAITLPDQEFRRASRGADWIQQYIFPGSSIPSVTALAQAMTQHSQFVIEDMKSMGLDYAKTLWEWHQRFDENIARVRRLGFDTRFIRMWKYYLSYCEAGFRARYLNAVQLVFSRARNTRREPVAATVSYLEPDKLKGEK